MCTYVLPRSGNPGGGFSSPSTIMGVTNRTYAFDDLPEPSDPRSFEIHDELQRLILPGLTDISDASS